MNTTRMYLNNEWVDAEDEKTMGVLNPATGETIAKVPSASVSDVEKAVRYSNEAFYGDDWHNMDASSRGRLLYRLAQITYEHAKELALIESQNNGKTFRDALGDVRFAAQTLEYYAGWADKIEGTTIPVPGERLNYTLRQPLGVTAHIIPWNFPFQLGIRSIAPALATGCTVIAKPASLTPLSILEWIKLIEVAKLPKGVLQVITGSGRVVGDSLVRSPDINGVSLTGSVETGINVMKAAAENITPITLELGGKGANIVMANSNLKRAVKGVAFGIFWNAGQMCWAGSRLLVEESVHDKFMNMLQEEVKKWSIGVGTNEGVRIGSMVSLDQRSSVLEYIDKGAESGAEILIGGKPPEHLKNGAFLEPTILSNVEKENVVFQEEIFGPVLTATQFTSVEEAITLANSTNFGLLNGVWTNELKLAHIFARDLDSGMVSVNEYPVTFPQTPFSGWKKSGIGMEQGKYALDYFSRTKNVNINYGI